MKGNAIIIIGNIASGKSTMARMIGSKISGYKYLCLDEIRKELIDQNPNMNSIVREREAEKIALELIDKSKNLIFESTGASQFFHRAVNRIKSQYRYYIVKMDANRQTCYERHEERLRNGHFTVAPGFKSRTDIKTQINQIGDVLRDIRHDHLASSEHFNELHLLNLFLISYSKFISKPQYLFKN